MNSFFKDNKKNHLWLSAQYLISMIISLITLKLNLLNFGAKLFGYWILISSVWGFGIVLDFGFGKSIIKYVSEYKIKDEEKINPILSSSYIIFFLLGIVSFVTILIIAHLVYFKSGGIIPYKNEANLWFICIILGFSFYFRFLSIFFRSIFEGYNDFVLSSQISLLNNILIFISVIIALILKQSMEILAYYYLTVAFITLVVFYFAFKIKYSHIIISVKYFKYKYVKEVMQFSIAVQGAAVFGSLIDPIIKYLVGNLSISSVSAYEIARRFVVAITGLFNNTFRTILPKASSLGESKNYSDFIVGYCDKLSRLGITYSGIVFGLGSIVFALLIKYVFQLNEAILIFLILALPESVNKFGFPIYNFLLGIGKAYFLTAIQLINLIVISISVYIGTEISKSSIGLIGYWFSVIIVNIIMLRYMYKMTSVSMWKYLKLSGIFKLVTLNLLLIASIIGSYLYGFNVIYILIGLSIFSIFIFINDVKMLFAENLI